MFAAVSTLSDLIVRLYPDTADIGEFFFVSVEKAEHLFEHRFVFFFHRVSHNSKRVRKAFVMDHAARAHQRHISAFLHNGKSVFAKKCFPAGGIERLNAHVYGFA